VSIERSRNCGLVDGRAAKSLAAPLSNMIRSSPLLLLAFVFTLTFYAAGAAGADNTTRPKIRAITGFVDVDAQNYPAEFAGGGNVSKRGTRRI
jgi:hypothetical protein